jgi:hypothetical protein
MSDTAPEMEEKDYGAIKVGKDRFYWVAYRYMVWLDMSSLYNPAGDPCGRADRDPRWLIAEGFEATLEAALGMARDAAIAAPGPMRERLHHKQAAGNMWISGWYRQFHARKPTPSDTTGSRPVGSLGYVWRRAYNRTHDMPPAVEREDGWDGYAITKITAKRIWISAGRYAGQYGGASQKSFDRAKLERGDCYGWHTEVGMAAIKAERTPFLLLGLTDIISRKQVMAAFRKAARQLHPDAGGDAAQFRSLVAEKDRALRMAA